MIKYIFFMLIISSVSYANPFPCPVYSEDGKDRLAIVTFINPAFGNTKFVTYINPETEYSDFATVKVKGFINKSCLDLLRQMN